MKSKEMKKYIRQLISCMIFSALVWTAFLRCTYLFRETTITTRQQILGFYLEEPDSLDVVFIGPSSVHNYWSPMLAWHEYGFTSYSYSVSAMTMDAMKYCMRDIQKRQNSVIAVVDVRRYLSRFSPNDINEAGHRNLLDSLDFNLERLMAINYVRKLHNIPIKEAIAEFIDLIHYHKNKSVLSKESNWILWENRLEEYPSNEPCYKGSWVYVPPYHEFLQNPDITTDEISELNESDEIALRDFLMYCQKNNVQVLLTAAPYIFNENDLRELNMIEKIADEYDITFLNFNQHLNGIDFDYTTDFCDINHTNIFGIEKYTHYVADFLKEHYTIPEHHDIAVTTAWNELYS